MNFETITVRVKVLELKKLKAIVAKFRALYPDTVIKKTKYGKISEDLLVSMDVDENHYRMMIEKFSINKIAIVTTDEKVKKIIEETGKQISIGGSSAGNTWDDLEKKRAADGKVAAKSVEEYVKEGNYEELVKIARDFRYGKEAGQKAKNNIPRAVTRAIEKATNMALTRSFEIPTAIERLLKIASDENLKTLQFIELIRQAGMSAVEICFNNNEYVGELIDIANDSSLDKSVNIKAATNFAKVALREPTIFQEDISLAIRNLNIRWLKNIYDVVLNSISEEDKKLFNELVAFINENRTK